MLDGTLPGSRAAPALSAPSSTPRWTGSPTQLCSAGITIWLATGGHDRLLAAVALFCLVAED